jgi:large subunit ribosomal protein L13
VRTYTPKPGDVERRWHVIDASDVVLGRLASQVAIGSKREQKKAYRHSGYPGGLKAIGYVELLDKHPERAVEKAVRGMIPKNSLGRQTMSKLKVYAGPDHPHAAQKPEPFEITQIAQ